MRSTAVAIAAALIASTSPSRADEPTPLSRFAATRGFIDDAFALSDDGAELAWLITDGATFCELHRARIAAGEIAPTPCTTFNAESLRFLDGERVLLVDRDASTGLARAQIFDRKGAGKRLGPFTDLALADVAGVPAIVTHLRTGAAHAIVAVRRDTLAPLARATLAVENDALRVGGAKGVSLREPRFVDGWTRIMGLRAGGFDKASDQRRPDGEARVDAFTGKILDEKPIGDRVARGQLEALLHKHEPESISIQWNEMPSQILLVNETEATPLVLPRPVAKYEPASLHFASAGAGGLYLSLTVDPVNADAVRSKRADIDFVDLYRLDVAARTLSSVLRLDGKKHPTRWTIGADHLALLRKHAGFPRGGTALEVFALPK